MYVFKRLRLFASCISKGTKQLPMLHNSRDEMSEMLSFQNSGCKFRAKDAKACLGINISQSIRIQNICFKRYYLKICDLIVTVCIFINVYYCWGQRQCFKTQNHVFKQGYIQKTKKIFCLKSHTKWDSSFCELSES